MQKKKRIAINIRNFSNFLELKTCKNDKSKTEKGNTKKAKME